MRKKQRYISNLTYSSLMSGRLKYLRAKPLIDDITHRKPSVLFTEDKVFKLLKLPSTCRINNEYEQKLKNNLYFDILSQPLRVDQQTGLSFPRSCLIKFEASIVESVVPKEKAVALNTTLNSLQEVIIQPQLDVNFQKFENSYWIFTKHFLQQLNERTERYLIPIQFRTLKRNDFNLKNVEFKYDTEFIEQKMLEHLSRLVENVENCPGNDILISLDGTGDIQTTGIILNFDKVENEIFKKILFQKFNTNQISLEYNIKNKALVQFVYKIINYYS